MTYFLRGAILSSAAFFLIYVLLSFVVATAWRLVNRHAGTWSSSLLFGIRVFPLIAAAIITSSVVLPSFLYLEPYATSETIGVTGLTLASGGVTALVFGFASVLVAWWNTSRLIGRWPRTAVLPNGIEADIVGIKLSRPLFLVAGVCRPQLMISEGATSILEASEMQAAIRHELAHVASRDNLKKLVLRFAKFPFMAGLEQCWMQAAEFAADDAAAIDEATAVDLASALLKVASQPNSENLPDLAMSLNPEPSAALRVRVERLLTWKPKLRRSQTLLSFAMALTVVGSVAATYLPLLRYAHELSELLVR